MKAKKWLILSWEMFFVSFVSGKSHICPECGSDHVVQVAEQTTPYSSTPNFQSARPHSEDNYLDFTQSTHSVNKVFLILSVNLFCLFVCSNHCLQYLMFCLYFQSLMILILAKAVVPFQKLLWLSRIPHLSQPREAPSLLGMFQMIQAAFPTT